MDETTKEQQEQPASEDAAPKKTSVWEVFGTDQKSEEEGIWINYGDFAFRVARAGGNNRRYRKRLEALTRPYRKAIQTESLPDKKAESLMRTAFAETVLLDWVGVTDEKTGEEMPFSVDNAKALFEKLPDLFSALREEAGNFKNFQQEVLDAAAKN